MKKFLFGITAAAAVFALSCGTAPAPAASASSAGTGTGAAAGEYTQEHADSDFEKVYDTYKPKIIMDGAKSYTVVKGDTLSKIALREYGSANNYGYFFPVIMMASDVDVLDPELIEPGMILMIPDLQKNLADPGARAAIKAFLKDIAAIYQKKDKTYSALTEANLINLSNSL